MTYVVTDSSTQHGNDTPHGFYTPHRFPRKIIPKVDYFKMSSTLYPTGRAFNLPEGSNFANLQSAFNLSLQQLIEDAQATLTSTFPDNDAFDSEDADLWEYRLGIDFNPYLTLDQRRTNIYNAIAFPQNIKARQHPLYIQDQLIQAGFDVKVYENRFIDGGGNVYYKTPAQVLGTVNNQTQFGGGTQFGGVTQFGGGGYSVIANSEVHENYSIGGILWATFFIAGDTITTPFNIPASRETEFRRKLLKLKPAHTVAFLIGNFI